MPDQPPIATPERAFISRELRPDATIREEGAAPPAPRDVCSGGSCSEDQRAASRSPSLILLALAGSRDELARHVLAQASQAGLEAVRVGEAELASLLLCWELPESDRPAYLVAGGRRIDVRELAGVLVRWLPRALLAAPADDEEEYLHHEWLAALLGFLRALPCPVVNRPKPLGSFRQPLLAAQGEVLRAAGLRLPPMLVTASAAEAREFESRYAGRIARAPLPAADSYPACLVAAPEGARRRVLVAGAEAYADPVEGAELARDLARRCVAAVRGLDLDLAELIVVSAQQGDTVLDLTDAPDWDLYTAEVRDRAANSLLALLAGAQRRPEVGA
jgi:hypothetical protein